MKRLSAILLVWWVGILNEAGMMPRKMTTLIVVHHSATLTGNAEVFRRYHVNVRHWADIGYHFVITREGKIEAGRPEHLIGAHALTGRPYSRNPFSVGVCLVGKDTFTDEQIKALICLLVRLCRTYHINPLDSRPKHGIEGHHENCPGPGLDLEKIKKEVFKALYKEKRAERARS